jgi:signal transduction histidine kinase/CheY-like chemotaxis protein
VRLGELLDISALERLAAANHKATGMPIGIIDAVDGSVLVGFGWQDVCVLYHRTHPLSAERCRESDAYITEHLSEAAPCEYTCKNGLRDIGIPIRVAGEHLATLFLGQFFYEGESPDRAFFASQARELGFDEAGYLAAVARVPTFSRAAVEDILSYNAALARVIADLAEGSLRRQRTEQALREAHRRKDEFLGMLSHELRNPLAPIRNSIYLLKLAPPGSDQARRAQGVIERQTDHLTRLVDDLLDVTRVARGKIELRRSRVDLREVVSRAADDFRLLLRDRGIAFVVEVADVNLWADADATRITQLVGNLLHNAAKFTRPGDVVTLSVQPAGPAAAEVRVRDTGVGIDPALLPSVFEPFVQGERTLARSEGGLGLGLALVKGIAEMHGGAVRVESAGKGQGAEFAVTLPVAPGGRAGPPSAGAPRSARGLRVLVVDDNTDAAESLAEIVGLLGHVVEIALDGPSAIEKARAGRPDVVLCDIGLPGMSGYEVARALRAEGDPRLRLIAVSGYAGPEDVSRAAEAGFDAHLAKPADPAEIERLLAC